MTDRDEVLIVAENMSEFGGSFVKLLGETLLLADDNNVERIKKAFPEYWVKYKNFKNKEVVE